MSYSQENSTPSLPPQQTLKDEEPRRMIINGATTLHGPTHQYLTSKSQFLPSWIECHHQENERHIFTPRKALQRAMKALRSVGIAYHPRQGECILPLDKEEQRRVRAAQLAWRKFRDEKRTGLGWERILTAAAKRLEEQRRACLQGNEGVAARAVATVSR